METVTIVVEIPRVPKGNALMVITSLRREWGDDIKVSVKS